jgi:DNA-binding GntR family transcriptional regulator
MVSVSHGLRRQNVVQSILQGVFEGRFTAGQRLVVQRLAEEFGVSPTPIREALVELAGIGIVDLLPNRGAVVRSLTRQDVDELCQIRRVLETEAARSACGRLDRNELTGLVEELSRLVEAGGATDSKNFDADRFVTETRAVDAQLHDLISKACGSRRLSSEIGRFRTIFRSFRHVGAGRSTDADNFRRAADENAEHLAIAQALLDGDSKRAAKAMSRHIDEAVRHWGQRIISALESQAEARKSPRSRGDAAGKAGQNSASEGLAGDPTTGGEPSSSE